MEEGSRLTRLGMQEEQREATRKRLDAFVNTHRDFFLKTIKTPGGNVLILAKTKEGEVVHTESVARVVMSALKYKREHVQNAGYGVGECAKVARDAVAHFKDSFPKWATFSVESKQGAPLPFFKEQGFRNHVVNYIAHGNAYVAVDLNAGTHMDRDKGDYSLFVIVADSKEDIHKTLERLYHTV